MRALPLVAALLVGCASPPDSAVVEALTSGVWHAEVGEDDYVYEFMVEDGKIGGRVHRVNGTRQINEVPLSAVSFEGTAIKIEHGRFPPYFGEADLEGGRIEGGIPRERRFSDMDLARVERSEWPMLWPRFEPTGEPIWTHPEETGDGWPAAAPSDVGLDPDAVEATLRAIVDDEAAALHSILVVRDGRLVVEEYFHGWDRDDLHSLLSCTKSVASLLTGIAIDQGHLEGTEVPVLDFFPEHRRMAGSGWEDVRLDHLLTMTMGLDWKSHELGTTPPPQVDRFVSVLGHEVVETPGSEFVYAGRGVDLLAGILLEATGREADRFAETELFDPIGIDQWDWDDRRWQGHPFMGAGLKLRPRDMAKIGQLVLDEGSWGERWVVSAEWVEESTRAHVMKTFYDVRYGYLWWRIDPPSANVEVGPVVFANGLGSKFIAVAPEARMVVVATGGNSHNGRQFDIVSVAERYLLPGVR